MSYNMMSKNQVGGNLTEVNLLSPNNIVSSKFTFQTLAKNTLSFIFNKELQAKMRALNQQNFKRNIDEATKKDIGPFISTELERKARVMKPFFRSQKMVKGKKLILYETPKYRLPLYVMTTENG